MKKRLPKTQTAALSLRVEKERRRGLLLVSLLLCCLLSLLVIKAKGQDKAAQPTAYQQTNTSKEYLGPSGDSIRPYRPAGIDPFKKKIVPKKTAVKPGSDKAAKLLGFAPLEERRAKFRQLVEEYAEKGMNEPNPVMQYLVSELDVMGVFRDEQGYGAFVRAIPTGTTFFVRRGTRCFNGEILRIESDASDTGSKVTFRQESYEITADGKQKKNETFVAKNVGGTAR